ncbi:MAG: Slp/YeaY family lipoprotein [Deltaproteobacteria bacterium]|nr:Slp/YeaY family lipoprotein [Deltaproteobacteria bacterium]
MKRLLAISAALLLVAGCSVISKEARKDVDRDITVDMVQSNPELYRGRKVLWGGVIMSSENLEHSTVIEVLETELNMDDRPADGSSRGRFLIESPKFLDTDIFKAHARVTVAGTIKRVEVRKIGRMDYAYPVVTPMEISLTPASEYRRRETPPPWFYSPYYPYPPYGPYYPYYPYHPWWPYRYP